MDAPLDVLRVRELAPFRAAIAAGVDAVMTSHVVLSAFDDAPATVSAAILGGLLRHELGFDGVVVTDALDMKAVSRDRTIASVAVDALAAGADLVCLGAGHDDTVVDAARAAIDGAVADGRMRGERLADATERAGRLASPMVPGRAAVDRELGACAARRALRVHGRLPGDLRASHVVELRPPPHQAAGDVPWGLAEAIAALGGRATVTRLAAGRRPSRRPHGSRRSAARRRRPRSPPPAVAGGALGVAHRRETRRRRRRSRLARPRPPARRRAHPHLRCLPSQHRRRCHAAAPRQGPPWLTSPCTA